MKINVLTWLLCIFITILSSNAVFAKSQGQFSWKNHAAEIARLNQFRVNGKIAVNTTKDSGSATIDWSQRDQTFFISLSGPLGSNQLYLAGRPGAVQLSTSNGKQYNAQSAEQLLAEFWGFRLPVSNLRYWVRGIPVPTIPAKAYYDNYHRLYAFTQQGFYVQYLNYTVVNGYMLPQKISIRSPELNAKLIIYGWSV